MKSTYFKVFAFVSLFVFAGSMDLSAQKTARVVKSTEAALPVSADLVQAKDVIQEAAKKYPKNAELQIQLGFIFKKMKRYGDSRRAFEEAVKIDPKLVEGHYMLGLIYEYRKETNKALKEWQECLNWASDPEMKNTAILHIHHLDPKFPISKPKAAKKA